ESQLERETFELVLQVNGRVRDRVEASVGESEEDLVERAKASPRVQAHLDGKEIRQTIVVPGKLVNLVVYALARRSVSVPCASLGGRGLGTVPATTARKRAVIVPISCRSRRSFDTKPSPTRDDSPGRLVRMPEYLLQRRRLFWAAVGSLALILLLGRFVLGAGTTTTAASLPPPPA